LKRTSMKDGKFMRVTFELKTLSGQKKFGLYMGGVVLAGTSP